MRRPKLLSPFLLHSSLRPISQFFLPWLPWALLPCWEHSLTQSHPSLEKVHWGTPPTPSRLVLSTIPTGSAPHQSELSAAVSCSCCWLPHQVRNRNSLLGPQPSPPAAAAHLGAPCAVSVGETSLRGAGNWKKSGMCQPWSSRASPAGLGLWQTHSLQASPLSAAASQAFGRWFDAGLAGWLTLALAASSLVLVKGLSEYVLNLSYEHRTGQDPSRATKAPSALEAECCVFFLFTESLSFPSVFFSPWYQSTWYSALAVDVRSQVCVFVWPSRAGQREEWSIPELFWSHRSWETDRPWRLGPSSLHLCLLTDDPSWKVWLPWLWPIPGGPSQYTLPHVPLSSSLAPPILKAVPEFRVSCWPEEAQRHGPSRVWWRKLFLFMVNRIVK